jgi:MFS family permease
MGFPKTWTVLIPLRMLLGLLEAGFFPGCVYLLSTWYSRYDIQKRYSVFYLIGSMASAFASILAYGLMQMKGLGGLNGWRWIFIMQGVVSCESTSSRSCYLLRFKKITCIVGIGGYFGLVDFPDKAAKSSWRFLSERECNFILRRVEKDRGDTHLEPFTLGRFLRPGLDPKIWGFALIFL